jgi:hypothetical protein
MLEEDRATAEKAAKVQQLVNEAHAELEKKNAAAATNPANATNNPHPK